LAIVGVDAIKGDLFDKMPSRLRRRLKRKGLHFSSSLEPVFYQQLASEHHVVDRG
jgi:hypothetical protein